MEPDKRQFVRKRTDQLLYAEFGQENGSILLNLSEAGCSFQSIAPVRDKQLHFWVSVGDGRKLEGDGQMVWSDTAKKMGGLRFLNPSQELREQVRAWLNETLVTGDGKLDPTAVESQAKRRRKKLREEARAEAEKARRDGALKAGNADTVSEGKGLVQEQRPLNSARIDVNPALSAVNDSTSRVGDAAERSRRIWLIALSLMLLMVMVTYRRELGHLVMSFGSRLAGEEEKARPTTPVETRPVPENASVDVKPAAMPDTLDTPNESGADTADTGNGQLTRSASEAAGPVPTRQKGGAEDVPSLWVSVENGDTHAEVVLASRYVQGEGVEQSCAQARVLLEAAVKRGSREAKQKLDELGQVGCQ
jgi:hypothetical protein